MYLELFWSFFKVGIFTFGGGYAMLPILQREITEKKKWVTEAELMDYYAVGQCTPGVIAVNTATFVGYKKKGLLGGIMATIGLVCPSILIILLIAMVMQNFADYPVVQNAFAGIRICVCVLVLNAVVKLWKSAVIDKRCILLFAMVFFLSVYTGISTVFLVVLSAIAGIAMKGWEEKKRCR